jgi:hypothetical protein
MKPPPWRFERHLRPRFQKRGDRGRSTGTVGWRAPSTEVAVVDGNLRRKEAHPWPHRLRRSSPLRLCW